MDLAQKVKMIEALELDIGEKKNLLLVAAGQKPNCILEIRYCLKDYLKDDTFYLNPYFLTDILQKIDQTGLRYEQGHTNIKETRGKHRVYGLENLKIETKLVYIGSQAATLRDILNNPEPKHPRWHESFGRLMGFPETAIQAFCYNKEDLTQESTFSLLIKNPYDRSLDILRFLNFKTSKSNHQEEIKHAKRQHDTIKLLSPKIYEKVIRWEETMQEGQPPTEEIKKFLYTSAN